LEYGITENKQGLILIGECWGIVKDTGESGRGWAVGENETYNL